MVTQFVCDLNYLIISHTVNDSNPVPVSQKFDELNFSHVSYPFIDLNPCFVSRCSHDLKDQNVSHSLFDLNVIRVSHAGNDLKFVDAYVFQRLILPVIRGNVLTVPTNSDNPRLRWINNPIDPFSNVPKMRQEQLAGL